MSKAITQQSQLDRLFEMNPDEQVVILVSDGNKFFESAAKHAKNHAQPRGLKSVTLKRGENIPKDFKITEPKATDEKAAAEKAEADKKATDEKAAAEKAEADKKAADEKAAAEKAEADKKAADEKAAAEKAETDKKAADEKAAAEKAEADKKAADEKAAAEKAEADKKAAETSDDGDNEITPKELIDTAIAEGVLKASSPGYVYHGDRRVKIKELVQEPVTLQKIADELAAKA